MLWRLKQFVTQVEVLAATAILAGFVLLGAVDQSVLGALLVSSGAYMLVLPEFIEPHNPAA